MPNELDDARRLIVVSNRLPISVVRDDKGLRIRQGAGGLVTAMAPVLRDRGGLWVGWPGTGGVGVNAVCREFSREAGYLLRPVPLDEADVAGFYQGFSNEILWPLFHEFMLPCNFLPAYWEAYNRVNMKFSAAVAAAGKPEDFIWVHDYHLMLMGKQLKDMGKGFHTGFFLHIPFPPADFFLRLPWRRQVVDALLEFDLVGFQTLKDRVNFAESVRRLHPGSRRRGRGQVVSVSSRGRQTRIGGFPISIDFKSFVDAASRPQAVAKAKELREAFGNRFIVFGADRLDYSKGIPERLNAFAHLLENSPDLHEHVSMIQVTVPSREDVPMYRDMKAQIERMVTEINGRYATPGWTPVNYVYRNLPREELVTYYQAADMCLVSSLRDGMNLVAKEYVACNIHGTGTLCLSEFAGAAMEFHRHAVMINPFDVEGVAQAIREAMETPVPVRQKRMHALRDLLRRYDVFHWVDSFLLAAFSKRLGDFPTNQGDFYLTVQDRMGPPWDEPGRPDA